MRALAWMAVALASFTLVAIAGREAARGIGTLDMMFYRSAVSLLGVAAWAAVRGELRGMLPTQRLPLHVTRGAVHCIAQFSWLHALTLLPLAQLFALEFTAPLWVALIAPLMLGERLTMTRALAALIGFAGTMVVLRPGQLHIGQGEALALIAALGFALSMMCTKLLTSTEPAMRIMLSMFLVQTVICAVLTAGRAIVPDSATFGWILVLSACGFSAHYALVRAFSLADSIIVAPMDFLRLPLIAAVGIALYAEPIDPLVMAGGGIVVLANLLNLWGERRVKPA